MLFSSDYSFSDLRLTGAEAVSQHRDGERNSAERSDGAADHDGGKQPIDYSFSYYWLFTVNVGLYIFTTPETSVSSCNDLFTTKR